MRRRRCKIIPWVWHHFPDVWLFGVVTPLLVYALFFAVVTA
jgi:hypothetical protein